MAQTPSQLDGKRHALKGPLQAVLKDEAARLREQVRGSEEHGEKADLQRQIADLDAAADALQR